MGKKLYVGNLSYDMSEGELTELFSAHGTVSSVQIIIVRLLGRLGSVPGFARLLQYARTQGRHLIVVSGTGAWYGGARRGGDRIGTGRSHRSPGPPQKPRSAPFSPIRRSHRARHNRLTICTEVTS